VRHAPRKRPLRAGATKAAAGCATRVITDTPGRTYGFAAGAAIGAGRDAGTTLRIRSANGIAGDRQQPAARVPGAGDRRVDQGWAHDDAHDDRSSCASSLVSGVRVRSRGGQARRRTSRIDTSGRPIRGGIALIAGAARGREQRVRHAWSRPIGSGGEAIAAVPSLISHTWDGPDQTDPACASWAAWIARKERRMSMRRSQWDAGLLRSSRCPGMQQRDSGQSRNPRWCTVSPVRHVRSSRSWTPSSARLRGSALHAPGTRRGDAGTPVCLPG
jgi:hypothetical protein